MNSPKHPIAKEAIAIRGPIAINREEKSVLEQLFQTTEFDKWCNTRTGDKYAGNHLGDVKCDKCGQEFILLLNWLHSEIDINDRKQMQEIGKLYGEKLLSELDKEHSKVSEHKKVYPLRTL
jgi:hypothetical protein